MKGFIIASVVCMVLAGCSSDHKKPSQPSEPIRHTDYPDNGPVVKEPM